MHTRSLTVAGLAAAILAVAAPASAGGGGHSICPAFSVDGPDGIELRDSCMAPVSATAAAGATITVTNVGAANHTYTALDGSFDTGVIEPGGSVDLALPDTSGTMPVYCTLHSDRSGNGMAGTLTLEALSTEPVSAATGGGFASTGFALVGGFVIGSATIAAVRRRDARRPAEEVEG